MNKRGWIGFDLDGTLAYYDEWRGGDHVGEPIKPMMELLKKTIEEDKYDVRIFTARACVPEQIAPVKQWLLKHGLPDLEVTNIKDYDLIFFYDDRCVQVIPNEGVLLQDMHEQLLNLTRNDESVICSKYFIENIMHVGKAQQKSLTENYTEGETNSHIEIYVFRVITKSGAIMLTNGSFCSKDKYILVGKFTELADSDFEQFVEFTDFKKIGKRFRNYLDVTNPKHYLMTAEESFKSLCKSQGFEDDYDLNEQFILKRDEQDTD
jgi:hypothetical protein